MRMSSRPQDEDEEEEEEKEPREERLQGFHATYFPSCKHTDSSSVVVDTKSCPKIFTDDAWDWDITRLSHARVYMKGQ